MVFEKNSLCQQLTAVLCNPEYGLSYKSILALLKHNALQLTVLTSIVSSPQTFNKHQWMSLSEFFPIWKNSLTHYCFRYTFISFMLFGQTDVKLQRQKNINLLTEEFNPYCHTTNICFWYYGITNVFLLISVCIYVCMYTCTGNI